MSYGAARSYSKYETSCRLQTRKPSECGFSLLELMVVCAILGILAAMAIPSYQGQAKIARMNDAKALLVSLQSYANYYYMGHHEYPDSLTKLKGPSVQDALNSPYFSYESLIGDARCESCFILSANPKLAARKSEALMLSSDGFREGDW